MFTKNKLNLSLLSLLMTFMLSLTMANKTKAQEALALSEEKAVIDMGVNLFKGNCKQCHKYDKKATGPALMGVNERRELPWLISFIKGPLNMKNSGDEYAVALFAEYAPTVMPNHDFLKDQEIVAILSAVKAGAIKPKDDKLTNPTTVSAETEKGPSIISILGTISLVALALCIVALASMSMVLRRALSSRADISVLERETLDKRFRLGRVLSSPAFIGIAAFVFVSFAGQKALDGLFTVGVQQGYAPDQPIPFSHKLHAGLNKIDCKYCHTGVERSKNANIPSPNICMGCHNQIRNTSPNIQKIYEAVEKNQPIQWVRVHNLPDLAYFNHQQHVKVGGLDCEECHGDVKNMEIIQQHSVLTMGWCIACHRKKQIGVTNKTTNEANAYYDRLLELHAEKGNNEGITVEKNGGFECGKCHY